MLKINYLFLLLLLFTACKNTSNQQAAATVNPTKLFDAYYDERLKLFPFEATTAGINDYNDLFPIDITDAYRDTIRMFYQKYQQSLSEIDAASLSKNDQISYELLKWDVETGIEGLKHPDNLLPVNQFWSKTLDLGQLGSGEGAQPFKTVQDYENWLKRIGRFPLWVDAAIANMKKGIDKGWGLPKSLVVKVLAQLKPMAETATKDHLMYQPVLKLAKNDAIPAADKTRLTAAYTEMVEKTVKPSYQRLHDFMAQEYLPKARTTSGISAMPGGKEYYNYLVRYYSTTLDLTPDSIFELGQREVARIRTEMEKVKDQVGFKGDLKAFFKHVMENEPKLRPFTDPKQVLANFEAIHQKMKPHLADQFDMEPKTPFEIRRTEAFREASASAEYIQGSLENNRPGIFYVPIPDVKSYNLYQDESLFLHEAIPGHHYQISLQQENKSLPRFRQNLWYNAFGEGWALYTESLGKELGLYDDPYQYFGRLGAEMHRAIRLVVDVGLHTKGWTREQAIQYDLDNEADSEANIIAEVERYMAIPGQALSYKLGEQRILALKKMAQEKLGNRFDIKKFHHEVLNDGCVPLKVLEEKIKLMING